MELIFKTFKDPVTLLKIKLYLYYNGALYIGIGIRRTRLFDMIINDADF